MTESDPITDAADRVADLSCWSGNVYPKSLLGGITNTNFVVQDGTRKYVVRLGDDLPLHGIVRTNEIASSRAAHAIGIAPEIIHQEPGVLVMRFIEGDTLTASDIRTKKMLERLAALLRQCHYELPKHLHDASPTFSAISICSKYLDISRAGHARLADELENLEAMKLELAECIGEIDPVFCHNDLLASNFIDDGDRIWLIDWEYAGWNSALFDLANLSSNCELSPELENYLLQTYYGHETDPQTLHRFRAFKCASLLRESLWSIVQEMHSHLDFDYAAYTDEQLARFDKAYAEYEA